MKDYSPRFFTLTTAKDLFVKLEHDLAEVRRRPSDPYAAFNFFVTAEHLLDWLYPDDENKWIRKVRRKEPLLALVSHLASGAKHFGPLQRRHKSVRESGVALVPAPGVQVVSRSSPKLMRPPFPILCVRLMGDAAVKYGKLIDVVALAEEVYRYWKSDPALQ